MEQKIILIDSSELIEQLKLLNENFKSMNFGNAEEKIFFTRDEAQKHYKFSKREVDKIYNTILKDRVVDIGKCQRLAKVHIDEMLTDGVKMKHV